MGDGGLQGLLMVFWWFPKTSQLSTFSAGPHQVHIYKKKTKNLFFFHSFIHFFFFKLAEEANGSNFEPKFLVRIPKVSQHDVDDRDLIDFGSVNLHHSLSVALPRLQKRHTEEHRAANQTKWETHRETAVLKTSSRRLTSLKTLTL